MKVADSTTSGVMPPFATVIATTSTSVTLSGNVLLGGVGNGDTIAFSGPSWCTGTDIGAWESAANYYIANSYGYGKVIEDPTQSPYTQTTTAYVLPPVQVDCQGSLHNWSGTTGAAFVYAAPSESTIYMPSSINNCNPYFSAGYTSGNTNIAFYAGGDPNGVLSPQGYYGNGLNLNNDTGDGFYAGYSYGNNTWKTVINQSFLSSDYDDVYDVPIAIGLITAYSISSNVLTLTFSATNGGTISAGNNVYVTGTGVSAIDNRYFVALTASPTSLTANISASNASGSVAGTATYGALNSGEEMVAENSTFANAVNDGMEIDTNSHPWNVSGNSFDFNDVAAIGGTSLNVAADHNNFEGSANLCIINMPGTAIHSVYIDNSNLYNLHNSSTVSGYICSYDTGNTVSLLNDQFASFTTVTDYVYTNGAASTKAVIENPSQYSGTAPTNISDATTVVASSNTPLNITPVKVGLQLGGANGLSEPDSTSLIGGTSGGTSLTGTDDTGYGYQALNAAVAASDNTAVGYQSLSSNASGNGETALGSGALKVMTTGNYNTAIGFDALVANTSGGHNTAIGWSALAADTTGGSNTAIGYGVGPTNATTGSNNILIGTSTSCDLSGSGNSNETHICGSSADSVLITGTNTVGTESVTVHGELLETTTSSGVSLSLTNSAETCTLTPAASAVFSCSSDMRLKHDIRDTVQGIGSIMDIRIRDFVLNSNEALSTGVIAQELQLTHPELVQIGPNGFLAAQPPSPWIVVKSLQDMQREIDALTPGAFPFHKCFFDLLVCAD